MNALAALFARAKEDDPGLTQAELGKKLNKIALEKGWRGGFSPGGISRKLSNDALHREGRYPQYKSLMRIYAERNNLQIDDFLETYEPQHEQTALNGTRQDGVWQFLGHTHSKRRANEKSPSKEIRRALVRLEGGKAWSIGVTTAWRGEYFIREEITYLRLVEPNENIEMFVILEKPSRRLAKIPRYQRGICLGGAFGELEHRHPAIASGRCVFRRLDHLSDRISENASHWNDELRSMFCNYALPSVLKRRQIDYAQFKQLKDDESWLQEQYWFIDGLIQMLYEDKEKLNFGDRIFLRN